MTLATHASSIRPVTLGDIATLADIVRLDGQPAPLFAAVHALAAEVIGHKLFTIMCFDAERFEVERLFSNVPDIYPLSGRKKKAGSAWGDHTLLQCRPFRAVDRAGIRAAFDDHDTMFAMGLGAILNIPIAYDGRCVGTMNLTHVEGWYTAEHERIGVLLGSFLAAPLALHQAGFAARQPAV